jgi:transposase
MNTRLHAVTDAKGRPIRFFMAAGQEQRLHRCGSLGSSSLPKAEWLLADRGYDADWLREAFEDKGINVCLRAGRPARRP